MVLIAAVLPSETRLAIRRRWLCNSKTDQRPSWRSSRCMQMRALPADAPLPSAEAHLNGESLSPLTSSATCPFAACPLTCGPGEGVGVAFGVTFVLSSAIILYGLDDRFNDGDADPLHWVLLLALSSFVFLCCFAIVFNMCSGIAAAGNFVSRTSLRAGSIIALLCHGMMLVVRHFIAGLIAIILLLRV